ncbi:tyrosine-protein phosphatase [Nocardia sp. alder85J]|uniref:tyrosine-protein phosphatase n=1 Tax=Nocardia sp. alder85J TaxID=2862949 RepID=UPI001CD7C825|nr:tyrosine-protein phosphatase [Nocardia sp. alder85J]MCX4094959.1 tyrosine-protein phosphatase [Nocardia sp. alder85J]
MTERAPLAGASGMVNARDLGGLRTEDGRQVRAGRVVRSDSPTELDPAGLAYLLDEYGLRTVVDLRGATEATLDGRGELGDRVAHYHNLPVLGPDRRRLDLTAPTAEGSMLHRYLEYLDESPGVIVEALTALAAPEGTPALVHCAAGKDRTGVVIALLLGVVGVREEDIVADYAATGPNVAAVRARVGRARSAQAAATTVADLPDWVFAADAATMRQFLDHLSAEHGGAVAWATAAGLDPAVQQHLSETLLEPAS